MILGHLKKNLIVGIQLGLSFPFVLPLCIDSFINKVSHILSIKALWVAYFAP
jgi:hypothetical protein